MKRQLSWRFNNEERFSDYIEKYQLDRISAIVGKTFLNNTSIREKKADFGDHDGTLRVDICVEAKEGGFIIIENQYNKTNHDHFGKLFTYATMLGSEDKAVTDAVWIVERVREEHFNAVNSINDLLKKKGIDFRIWLLVASLTENGLDLNCEENEDTVELRFPAKSDFFVRGTKEYDDPEHKAELDEFMPMLMNYVSDELVEWKSPSRAPSTPHCIGVRSNRTVSYDFNIPFRVKEKRIKVEARFNDEFYKNWIENNWEVLTGQLNEELLGYIEQYSIKYEITKSYVKIAGIVKADITNEAKWSSYIEQTVDLVRVISVICGKVERF
ncbi:MAG: hypothetical protein IJ327_04925 [Lachnospiraceae bacterium]|nr:hypothetical protein [Lachnospiraceae bacterium]